MAEKTGITRTEDINTVIHQNDEGSEGGGLAKQLSARDLMGFGIGIFVLTGVEAKNHAGPAITISFAIAGVVGEVFAWIIGWDLVQEFALGSATVARGWSGYLQDALNLPTSLFGEKAPVNLGAIFIVVVLGVIAAVGIRESK